jgi:hypothetical protein
MGITDTLKGYMNTGFIKAKQDDIRENIRGFNLNLDEGVKRIKDKAADYSRKEIKLDFLEQISRKIYSNPNYISIIIFIQFIMLLIFIFYYNPMSVNDKYPLIVKLFTLVIAFTYGVLYFFIKLKVQANSDVDLIKPTEKDILLQILIIVVFFILVMFGLKGLFWLALHTPLVKVMRHSMLILCVIVMLGGVYIFFKKQIDKAKNAPGKPISALILKFILYIPCLIVDIIEYVKYEINLTTKPIWILAGVEAVLVGLWIVLPFLFDKITNLSGLKLLNAPIHLNKETTIGNYKQLHEKRNLLVDKKSEASATTINQYANTKEKDNNSADNCNNLDVSGNVTANCAKFLWREHGCSTTMGETQESGKFMLMGHTSNQSFDLSKKSLEEVKNYIAESIAKDPDSCAAMEDDTSGITAKGSYTDPNVPKNKHLAWIYNKIKRIPIFKIKFSKHPQYKDTELRRFRYTYAISGWFYLNPQPPNTSSAYNNYTNILNYGENVNVEYNGNLNSLRVRANVANPDNDTNNMSVQIYETTEVLYQKWNNIVINYDNGYLDVFLNGALVGSKAGVAPYMSFDNIKVGAHNGLQGGICNVSYSENVMKKSEIVLKYKSLRDNSFPYVWSISDDFNTKLVQQEPNPKGIKKIKNFLGVQ